MGCGCVCVGAGVSSAGVVGSCVWFALLSHGRSIHYSVPLNLLQPASCKKGVLVVRTFFI